MNSSGLGMTLHLDVRQHVRVVSCLVTEGLSERTAATLEVATDDDLPLEQALASEAKIELSGVSTRSFTLRLTAGEYLGHEDGSLRYKIELRDPLFLCGLSKHTRKFRKLSAQQIVTQVLDESRVAHRWQTTQPTPVRKYCAQYRETNLAFVERLLEFEGIHYFFEDDGTMVLGDASETAERVRKLPFELIEAAGALARGEEGIHELRRGSRAVPGRVTLADYNWKKPKLDLRTAAFAERDTLLEVYEYPAGFRLPEQGARLAKLRLEAHRVQARFVEGRANVVRFAPGLAFGFGAGAGEAFAGEFLLTRVEHRYEAGEFGRGVGAAPGKNSYECSFVGMPLEARFRPMPKTPRPTVQGNHTAMVRGPAGEEIHTDEHGRFRAQFHWDEEGTGTDDDSRWLRMVQESTTSMALARTGWEVFVGYIDGDPDRPIGLGRAINGIALPAYGLPDNKNLMTIQTPSSPATGGYNEIKMDDSAGAQGISIRAEKDLDALVKNEKTEKIGNNETHEVDVDLTRQVQGNQTITIGGNADATYGANAKLVVEKNRVKTVAGSESVDVGGGAGATTGGSETEKVGSLRLTIAGAIKKPNFAALAKSAGNSLLASASPQAAQALATVQSLRSAGSGGSSQLTSAASSATSAAAAALVKGQGAGGAAAAAGQSLTSMLPSQQSLKDLVPSASWIPSADGLQNAVKGVVAKTVDIDNVVNLVCAGGIERMASSSMLKLVGGVYLTVAVMGIDVKVGLGYIETVGGVKLTLAAKEISETVEGKLVLTVGGTVMRLSTALMSFSSEVNTAIKVGAMAKYKSENKIEIVASKVKITAQMSLKLKGGGAEIVLNKNAASLKGKLHLDAPSGDVVVTGSTLNLT